MTMDNIELATVLAALRYWQRNVLDSTVPNAPDEWDVATSGGELEPLNSAAVDDLCERLNCPPTSIWSVELIARDIQVTASSEDTAESYARSDARQFRGDWNYVVGEVEQSGDDDDLTDDAADAVLDLCLADSEDDDDDSDEKLWTFDATWVVYVRAADGDDATEQAQKLFGITAAPAAESAA